MPAQIDAQGRLISKLALEYEELFVKAPRIAARARTAEAIENALIEIDEAAEPKRQVAAWQMISPEHWRLERPPERTARDRKGRPIPHFAKKFDDFVKTARSVAPHEDAEAFAMRLLKVDRRSLAEEAQAVDVTRDGESWVATWKKGRGPVRVLVTAPSLPDAIAAATARLEAGEVVPAKDASGPATKRRNSRRWRGRKKAAADKPSAHAV